MSSEKKYRFYAKIIVTEREVVHDGYCSDAGEDEGEEVVRTIRVELSREEIKYMLDNEIIDKLGKGEISKVVSLKFEKIKKYHNPTLYCQQGSGYCGYTGYSYIESFTIYKSLL